MRWPIIKLIAFGLFLLYYNTLDLLRNNIREMNDPAASCEVSKGKMFVSAASCGVLTNFINKTIASTPLTIMKISDRNFSSAFIIKASRSSGKGSQNVNKVSTKVELSFDVQNSALFSDEEKGIIFETLRARINNEGFLKIVCQTERSQFINKQIGIEKFYNLIIVNKRFIFI